MFLYFFDRWSWFDKVLQCHNLDASIKPWDYIVIDWESALVLWNALAFQELYKKSYWWHGNIVQHFSSILSTTILSFIHWFVGYHYTTYHNTIPLFLWWSIKQLIDKRPSRSTKQSGKNLQQQVFVFPTVRALYTHLPDALPASSILLTWSSTPVQKAKAYRGIKTWKITSVYCTFSQVFFDWLSLSRIVVHMVHAWQYKHQKDPRYYLPDITRELSSRYKCQYEVLWNVL